MVYAHRSDKRSDNILGTDQNFQGIQAGTIDRRVKTFFERKKRGYEDFFWKKKKGWRLFWKEKKGGEDFFRRKKRVRGITFLTAKLNRNFLKRLNFGSGNHYS